MDISTFVRTLLRHSLVIAVFVSYEFIIVRGLGTNAALPVFICFYIVDISYCYLCRYLFLPFIANSNWISIRLTIIPFIIVGYCLLEAATGNLLWLATVNKPLPDFTMGQITHHLWRGTYLFLLSLIFYMSYKSVQKEREKRLLELAFLKAQLNPHLLFNTLNFVYSTIEQSSAKGAKAISLLTETLHIALEQVNESDKVSLITEMGQVDRYLELSQLVSGGNLQITFTSELQDNPYEIFITSMLLLNFVDNTLKYAELTNSEKPAVLKLSASKEQFHFYTENLKRKTQVGISHKIGLSNTKKRLDRAYGNNYTMKITEDEYWFKLDLTIRL